MEFKQESTLVQQDWRRTEGLFFLWDPRPARFVGENPRSQTCGFGGLGGTRTPDALLRTEALYPLSYEAG